MNEDGTGSVGHLAGICRVALLGCVLTLATPAWSAPAWGEPTCTEWRQAQGANVRDWLLGYLSGMSLAWAAEGKTPAQPLTALASVEEPFVWVDRYCGAHPRASIGQAGIILFFELVRRKEGK